MKRISSGLHLTEEEFVSNYCVKDFIDDSVEIYFLKHTTKRCMFLDESNLCSVHDFKPIQCKKAPFEYFSYKSIWTNMPCLEEIDLDETLSKSYDEGLIDELLKGYV